MYKVDLERFCIHMPDGQMDRYNEELAIAKGITDEDMVKILETHVERHELFDRAEALPSTATGALRVLAEELKEIENRLQALWKFEVDSAFHAYWFRIPHCKCPKSDNAERMGSGMNVIVLSCPVHGGSVINGKIQPSE